MSMTMSWTADEIYAMDEMAILDAQLQVALDNDPQTMEWMQEQERAAKAKAAEAAKKAKAYDQASKRCTLKKGSTKVSFWTVQGGYCPFTITNGKKQFFKTVDTMRKRYSMLIKQGYTLTK